MLQQLLHSKLIIISGCSKNQFLIFQKTAIAKKRKWKIYKKITLPFKQLLHSSLRTCYVVQQCIPDGTGS